MDNQRIESRSLLSFKNFCNSQWIKCISSQSINCFRWKCHQSAISETLGCQLQQFFGNYFHLFNMLLKKCLFLFLTSCFGLFVFNFHCFGATNFHVYFFIFTAFFMKSLSSFFFFRNLHQGIFHNHFW